MAICGIDMLDFWGVSATVALSTHQNCFINFLHGTSAEEVVTNFSPGQGENHRTQLHIDKVYRVTQPFPNMKGWFTL